MSKESTAWVRAKTGWIDTFTGLLWELEYKTDINHYDAEKWAKEKGKRLPARDEFIEAEKHGIRKLEELKWRGLWFWSSTQYPGYDGQDAYVFDGYNGYADDIVNRNYSDYNVAARCVSPVGGAPGVGVDSKLDSLAERKSEALNRLWKAQELIHEVMGLME